MQNEILTHKAIQQKINRLAHQLYENCFEEKEIFLGGITGNGFILASAFGTILKQISNQQIHVFEIKIDKDEPWAHPVILDIDEAAMKHGFIFLIDDVLNSGKTMQYALNRLLQSPTKAIKTVALVDRTHRRYPIKADFVGIGLSTTLKERVQVDLDDTQSKAYLL
jgi:pyrimidine operon attenuation protein/uracil phosphoribosyltransferase